MATRTIPITDDAAKLADGAMTHYADILRARGQYDDAARVERVAGATLDPRNLDGAAVRP